MAAPASAKSMKRVNSVVGQLLSKNCSPFEGRFSNHLPHALVALDRLGAPASRLKEYAGRYSHGDSLKQSQHRVNRENWAKWRGKHDAFPDLLEFFESETERLGGDSRKTVRAYLPELAEGLIGQALHGIIQLGYCTQIGENHLISGGLAYLTHGFTSFGKLQLPKSTSDKSTAGESSTSSSAAAKSSSGAVDWKLPLSTSSLLSVLEQLRGDSTLPSLSSAGGSFTSRVHFVSSDPKATERFFPRYDLPLSALAPIVRNSSAFCADAAKNPISIAELSSLVIKAAVELYTLTGARDFFLLHGVTSAHALRTAMQFAFDDNSAEAVDTQLLCLAYMWRALVVAYYAQDLQKIEYASARR